MANLDGIEVSYAGRIATGEAPAVIEELARECRELSEKVWTLEALVRVTGLFWCEQPVPGDDNPHAQAHRDMTQLTALAMDVAASAVEKADLVQTRSLRARLELSKRGPGR